VAWKGRPKGSPEQPDYPEQARDRPLSNDDLGESQKEQYAVMVEGVEMPMALKKPFLFVERRSLEQMSGANGQANQGLDTPRKRLYL
jgi:hypothetical protein